MFDWFTNLFQTKKTSEKEKAVSGILAFIYVFAMGYIGSVEPGRWYESLNKPDVMPPNQLFGIVWIILFVLLGLSMYRVWNYYDSNFKRKLFAVLYAINGLFIYWWSQLFFGMHDMAGALYVTIGMIIVAELMIITAFHNNKKAAYILIPYLAWILFSTYLNATMIVLN